MMIKVNGLEKTEKTLDWMFAKGVKSCSPVKVVGEQNWELKTDGGKDVVVGWLWTMQIR